MNKTNASHEQKELVGIVKYLLGSRFSVMRTKFNKINSLKSFQSL